METNWNRGFILFFAMGMATLIGCSSSPAREPQPPPAPSTPGDVIQHGNEGYSLLYKLMSDEKDVGKIFILKKASDSVSNPIKEIGKSCETAKKQLDKFRDENKQYNYDAADLPYFEQRSRDLQASADKKALLTLSGKEFESRLVFTQMQAMNYATQLCKALDEKEQDPAHKAFLQSVGKQCEDFHDRLAKLLVVP